MNHENEERRAKKTVWGPGPFGLAQPTMPYEIDVPVHEGENPTPDSAGLRTKVIDIFIGTDRAIPVVLDTLDQAHASGKEEITDREIQRRINSRPRSLLITETGVRRALTKLTDRGQVSYRRLTAKQAVELKSNYGNNFSRVREEDQLEEIYQDQ